MDFNQKLSEMPDPNSGLALAFVTTLLEHLELLTNQSHIGLLSTWRES
jgi:hypothetical protein